MSFYKYQSAIGGKREKKMLVFIYIIFKRKIHMQVHFTVASQFHVYVDMELYVHVFMHHTFT